MTEHKYAVGERVVLNPTEPNVPDEHGMVFVASGHEPGGDEAPLYLVCVDHEGHTHGLNCTDSDYSRLVPEYDMMAEPKE